MAVINERKASNNFVTETIQNEDNTTTTMHRLPNPQEAVEVAFATIGADSYIEPNKDGKTIVLMKGAGTVTFKAGDTYASLNDYTATVTTEAFVALESSKFVNKKTGLIKVEKTGNTQVAVLEVR